MNIYSPTLKTPYYINNLHNIIVDYYTKVDKTYINEIRLFYQIDLELNLIEITFCIFNAEYNFIM